MLSEIAWFHLFTRLFLATKRVEEGCIHIWNSASEMLEVSGVRFSEFNKQSTIKAHWNIKLFYRK